MDADRVARLAQRQVFEELAYVWRLSLTHDQPQLRAYLRRRIEQTVEKDPLLAVKYDLLLRSVRDDPYNR